MTKRMNRVITAGMLLYDYQWQSPLAKASGVSQPHLANMVAGVRELNPDIERKIADALISEIKRIRRCADRAERIAEEMIADLEKNDD